MHLQKILSLYNITNAKIENFGSGLINSTWLVTSNTEKYILQKINTTIFKHPEYIDANINLVAAFLNKYFDNYTFIAPLKTNTNETIVNTGSEAYYRLFLFVKNSHTINVVNTAMQAYEAAKQFGSFTKHLANLNSTDLKITLPNFHNLHLRYTQFTTAINTGNTQRINAAKKEIEKLIQYKNIVDDYTILINNEQFKIRATHHDTKISNVLFDENEKGICVIDLDTLMPGYFISDVGDMMRTYLCPVSEEEQDFTKIEIRDDFFEAIANGYLSQMKNELTETEIACFVFSGKYMIYMQALRFLTDYLNNDVYYGAKYEHHNFIRAGNQIMLLEKLKEKEQLYNSIIESLK